MVQSDTRDEFASTATDLIVGKIRSMIISGEFPPGTRLKNNEIANMFGMSTTPIREALNRLEKVGLVEYRSRKGWEVKSIDVSELNAVYGIREYLERYAVHTLCSSPEEYDYSLLESINAEYLKNLQQGTTGECVKLDLRFHMEIMNLTENKFAISFLEQLMDIMFIRRSKEDYAENNLMAYEEHSAIIRYLKAKDETAAEDYIIKQIRTCNE